VAIGAGTAGAQAQAVAAARAADPGRATPGAVVVVPSAARTPGLPLAVRVAAVGTLAIGTPLAAQRPAVAPPPAAGPGAGPGPAGGERVTAGRRAAVPFGPGERARYEVRLGPAVVGRGSIEIPAVEVVRGRPTYRTTFRVRGGVPFYRVDDRLESWIDVETLATLRAVQANREGRRARDRRYEIYPERGVYVELRPGAAEVPTSARRGGAAGAPPRRRRRRGARAGPAAAGRGAEHATVDRPFDEGAFVQFVRTIPLEVGQRHVFDRYYKPDRNPVTVEVLRRERVTVPAGTFDAVVVRPSFRTKGIFAQSGGTEVWLSDDARRVVLRMKTHLPFGAITLALTEYTPPADAPAAVAPPRRERGAASPRRSGGRHSDTAPSATP
jgi:hypothetical protein